MPDEKGHEVREGHVLRQDGLELPHHNGGDEEPDEEEG